MLPRLTEYVSNEYVTLPVPGYSVPPFGEPPLDLGIG